MKFALTATPGSPSYAPILWRGSLLEASAAAADLGYDGIEWHLRRAEDVDAALLAEHMQRSRLEVPAIGTSLAASLDGLSFADPDPDVRHQAVARVQGHIRLAARLRAAVIIGLLWGRVGQDPRIRRAREDPALACLRLCCATAQVEDVTLLLEPINRYESDYPQTLAQGIEIINKIGAPNLHLLANTFHMNIEEVDIAASLRQAGPWLGYVHLADSNRHAPGHGHMDIAGVITALQEIGYDGYVSFEVLPLPAAHQAARDAICNAQEFVSATRHAYAS